MGNKDNVIILDGVVLELTPEQIEQLRKMKDEKDPKSPFDRVPEYEDYYSFDGAFEVSCDEDSRTNMDNEFYEVGNYCADESTMKQHALHMKLNNLLWRFSMTHGGDKIDWENSDIPNFGRYSICANLIKMDFVVSVDCFRGVGKIYFTDRKTAEAAIEEVVKPFVAEHPDFDWRKM